jgi:hypothetical protein
MNEFQQEWIVSPQEERLMELAEKYHADCESFDRTVCTGPIVDGGIMPATAQEGAAINRNALKVLAETLRQAESEGLTREDIRRAIGRYA